MPQGVIDILTSNIDSLWVINCAILVFIMQAGFMCMETTKQLDNIAKLVTNMSKGQKLTDDLALICIGK